MISDWRLHWLRVFTLWHNEHPSQKESRRRASSECAARPIVAAMTLVLDNQEFRGERDFAAQP